MAGRRLRSPVDLSALGDVFAQPTLNPLMASGPGAWKQAIEAAQNCDGPRLKPNHSRLPFAVADYVDFYSSLEHATNLGRMFRPDSEPLLPNWRWLPVGYHGRAGSVVVSGTDLPSGRTGQRKAPDEGRADVRPELAPPRLRGSRSVFVVGVGSELGEPVPIAAFADHVFGVVLVNDWSARDIQAWEYVPLGPVPRKVVPQTSISAWVTPRLRCSTARASRRLRRSRRRSRISTADATGVSTSRSRSS